MEKRNRARLASAAVVAAVFVSGGLVGMAVQRSLPAEPAVTEVVPQAPFDGPGRGGPGGGSNRGRPQRPMIYHQVLTGEKLVTADSLARVMEAKRDELERAFRHDMDSIFDASARPQQHRQDRQALITQLRNEIRGLMTPQQLVVYDSLLADEARKRQERDQQQQGQREGPGRQGRSGNPPN